MFVACPRYCGRILRGKTAKAPTPWSGWPAVWCAARGAFDQCVLNDITNYVMLAELGQPLHAFINSTKPQGAIHVRMPRAASRRCSTSRP